MSASATNAMLRDMKSYGNAFKQIEHTAEDASILARTVRSPTIAAEYGEIVAHAFSNWAKRADRSLGIHGGVYRLPGMWRFHVRGEVARAHA